MEIAFMLIKNMKIKTYLKIKENSDKFLVKMDF